MGRAALRCILRHCGVPNKVRLTPQDLRALHMGLIRIRPLSMFITRHLQDISVISLYRFYLSPFILKALSSHHPKGKPFPLFNPRLVKRINLIEPAGKRRLYLKHIEQLSYDRGGNPGDVHAAIRSSGPGKGNLCGPLFRMDKFIERMPAEIIDPFHLSKRLRDRNLPVKLFYPEECDGLIMRAFYI